jgi:hypothetical protein
MNRITSDFPEESAISDISWGMSTAPEGLRINVEKRLSIPTISIHIPVTLAYGIFISLGVTECYQGML